MAEPKEQDTIIRDDAPVAELRPKAHLPYPKDTLFPTFTSYTTTMKDFLTEYKCASPLFPRLFAPVIAISSDVTLLEAFQKLIQLKILSMPMLSIDGKLEGIFSMQDFMNILVTECEEKEITDLKEEQFGDFLQKKQFVTKKLKQFPEIGQLEPVVTVRGSDPILKAAQLMVTRNVHRVIVLDDSGNIINLITQSRLVALLSTVLDTVPDGPKTLQELNLGFKQVISVRDNTTAFQAFKVIRDKKLLAVAVVDEQGKLVGNVSVSDLKALGYRLEYFKLLTAPLFTYLRVVRDRSELVSPKLIDQPVLYVKPKDSLAYTLRLLYTYRVHRVYIVDDDRKPIGVVALVDVINKICAPFMTSSE